MQSELPYAETPCNSSFMFLYLETLVILFLSKEENYAIFQDRILKRSKGIYEEH